MRRRLRFWPVNRRGATVVVVTLITATVATITQAPHASAATSVPTWSASFAGAPAIVPVVTPAGDVVATGVRQLAAFASAGTPAWQLTASGPQAMGTYPTPTDSAGNTYIWVSDDLGWELESIASSGAVRWTTPALPIQGCCAEIALGWDGNVALRDERWGRVVNGPGL